MYVLLVLITHQSFHLYYKTNTEPIPSGSKKSNQKAWKVQIQQQPQLLPRIELRPDVAPAPVISSAFGGNLQETRQTDNEYVQFDSASLGFPTDIAIHECYVKLLYHRTEPIYTRLTPKLVTRNMPNAMLATGRGNLDRTKTGQTQANSQSISALRRFHSSQSIGASKRSHSNQIASDICRNGSRTFQYQVGTQKSHPAHGLHGPGTNSLYLRRPTLSDCILGSGSLYIIDIQPLTSLRAEQTTQAFTASVNFFRKHENILGTLRMDNQRSFDLIETARILKLQIEYISPEVERPNRAEAKGDLNCQKPHHSHARRISSRLFTCLLE
jgi:hypothetical protein